MIYLDNAATTLYKPEGVAAAMTEAVSKLGNSGRGAYGAALSASRLIFSVRRKAAGFFGADGPEQVVFTANATESLNIAIQGLFEQGDHVITTALEHNSVLRPLYRMEQLGVGLTIIPADRQGRISYEQLETAVNPQTRAVVCTHASNVTGNMVDLKAVSKICQAYGLLLVVDASQTAGIYPIDMSALGIDVLCFTGHKSLMGPQGIGGLCVRKGLTIRPLLYGGSGINSYLKEHPASMPEALESGTLNGPGIAGLGAAIDYLNGRGLAAICNQEQLFMERFYRLLSQIPQIKIYGDFTAKIRAPIVSLTVAGIDSALIADELFQQYGIAVRAGAHCAPLMHEALGTKASGTVRFSFSCMNTMEEVETAARAVIKLADED